MSNLDDAIGQLTELLGDDIAGPLKTLVDAAVASAKAQPEQPALQLRGGEFVSEDAALDAIFDGRREDVQRITQHNRDAWHRNTMQGVSDGRRIGARPAK